MGHKSNHLLQFKQNSLGAAVILILTSLAYKKKINDGSMLMIDQSTLLGCVFLLGESSDESLSLFAEKKIFSQHQLHSMKAKVLMEIGFGHEPALLSRSCIKISDPVMQVNILSALDFIFKGAPAAQDGLDDGETSMMGMAMERWEADMDEVNMWLEKITKVATTGTV